MPPVSFYDLVRVLMTAELDKLRILEKHDLHRAAALQKQVLRKLKELAVLLENDELPASVILLRGVGDEKDT